MQYLGLDKSLENITKIAAIMQQQNVSGNQQIQQQPGYPQAQQQPASGMGAPAPQATEQVITNPTEIGIQLFRTLAETTNSILQWAEQYLMNNSIQPGMNNMAAQNNVQPGYQQTQQVQQPIQ